MTSQPTASSFQLIISAHQAPESLSSGCFNTACSANPPLIKIASLQLPHCSGHFCILQSLADTALVKLVSMCKATSAAVLPEWSPTSSSPGWPSWPGVNIRMMSVWPCNAKPFIFSAACSTSVLLSEIFKSSLHLFEDNTGVVPPKTKAVAQGDLDRVLLLDAGTHHCGINTIFWVVDVDSGMHPACKQSREEGSTMQQDVC